ncbi:PLATZ transcription factor [Dillenia turbinata]|uniref:PLATZ transcription factor n=1 Tax=Dillenia turbinata TaxID=194707 RepID=A0AAN8UXA7_9MAGN
MVSSPKIPRWLEVLVGEKFFNPCLLHELAKKNEKNIYCLDCCNSICPQCLSPHRSHRLLQIRRYVYHDVIRLDDAEKLIDCAYVQAYINNSAKVIFLNQRPQTRPFRGSGNICSTCDRSLQDPFLFCSLSCKIHHILRNEGCVTKYLRDCEVLPFDAGKGEMFYDYDDGQMTPDSILEPAGSTGSSCGDGISSLIGCCKTLACTATIEFVRKKRSNLPYCRPVVSPVHEISANRRKSSTPHRSPLY